MKFSKILKCAANMNDHIEDYRQKKDRINTLQKMVDLVKDSKHEDFKKMHGNLSSMLDKAKKEHEKVREKIQTSNKPDEDLKKWADELKKFIKKNVTGKLADEPFQIVFANKLMKDDWGRELLHSVLKMKIMSDIPFVYTFAKKMGDYKVFSLTVNLSSSATLNISDKDYAIDAERKEPTFDENKVKAILVEKGLRQVKKTEEFSIELVKHIGTLKGCKLTENEKEYVISWGGDEELRNLWKTTLNVSPSEQSSMKRYFESAAKLVEEIGGNLSGHSSFISQDWYDNSGDSYYPSFVIKDNKVAMVERHEDGTPKAWSIDFSFSITVPKKKNLGKEHTSKVVSALSDLKSGCQTYRWGEAR